MMIIDSILLMLQYLCNMCRIFLESMWYYPRSVSREISPLALLKYRSRFRRGNASAVVAGIVCGSCLEMAEGPQLACYDSSHS